MTAILDCLPALMGQDESVDRIIDSLLKNENEGTQELKDMARLSYYMRIRIRFSQPQTVRVAGRRTKQVSQHDFRALFEKNGRLYQLQRRDSRYGYPISTEYIESWEPLPEKPDEFQSYQEFRRRFDTRFITETEIKSLWNSKSGQHGKQYRRSDFRKLSPTGRELMERFLRHFKDVNTSGPGYIKSSYGEYDILDEHYKSTGLPNSVFGRDLTISHQTNVPHVYYASEYPNCGNGRYGLIANEREYLWLEDD